MGDPPTELLALFREEANEYLDGLTSGLLNLELSAGGEERAALLREISRVAHSLKGAARTVNLHLIEAVAHHMETLFDAAQRGALALTPDSADVLYDGLDVIRALLNGGDESILGPQADSVIARLQVIGGVAPANPAPRADAPVRELPSEPQAASQPAARTAAETPEPAPQSPERTSAHGGSEAMTIRVSIQKLDALMAQASELLVSTISLEQRLADVRLLRERHAQWRKAWRKARAAYTRLSRDRLTSRTDEGKSPGPRLGADMGADTPGREQAAALEAADGMANRFESDLRALLGFVDLTQRYMRESAVHLLGLDQSMSQDHLRMSMVTSDLQDSVRRVRMLPFETILGGFQRMVRDLSRQLNKEIIFNVIGEQVELDKRVLEAIKDPIMHLLRNAIDHGIEPPEERVQAGKDPAGFVTLIVEQRGGEITVTVGDDGAGIDPEKVKRAAVRAGKITKAEAELLDEEEAISLIFTPGLSTREQVTTTSGRGIGMDVVRQNIEQLRGSVIVQNRPGLGTVFQLTVPVSLTTMRCMLARVDQETYAIPVAAIERIVEITEDDIRTVKGKQTIQLRGRPVTLVSLAQVLGHPHAPAALNARQMTVVLRSGEKLVAFLVDDLPSEQELVVKNLGKEMVRVRNVAGVAVLGTGKVVVILNPADLVKSAQAVARQRTAVREPPADIARPKARILVVDDSITTRTLEKNILEAAGYQVITATDGQEALDLVRHTRCDLIISDIEMPRMDGFKLTELVKGDEELRQVPLILVTSLDSPADRERGIMVGADAYIPKSSFDQGELLEAIGQLLY
mgnify:FL=1